MRDRFKSLLNRERRLKEELTQLTEEKDILEQRYQSLLHEREEQQLEFERWRIEHAELETKYDESCKEAIAVKRDLAHLRFAYKDQESRHISELAFLQAEYEGKEVRYIEELDRLQRDHADKESAHVEEVERLRMQHSETEAILGAQIVELRDAQTYVFPVDTVSHAELETMVEKLNAQVFQLSALVADILEMYGDDPSRSDTVKIAREALRDRQWLAAPMIDRLSRLRPEEQFWVQLGLQAVLTEFAARKINTWDFDHGRNRGLKAIHNMLFTEGECWKSV